MDSAGTVQKAAGLPIGALFSLYAVPVMYSHIAEVKKRKLAGERE
jgi:hypothetical protein